VIFLHFFQSNIALFSRKRLIFAARIQKGKTNTMANHKSAEKRIRQIAKKRLHNRYYKKTARTAVKNLRDLKDKSDAMQFLPKVVSMIDKLVKRNSIHKNKAANLKSRLMRHINQLG
jgi:small subunit ribosomal protein S20